MLLGYKFVGLESNRAPLKDGREDNLPAPSGKFFYAAEEKTGGASLTANVWLLLFSRTLLARAQVALQVGRCVGLAVGLSGSRTLPSNAPAAFRMQKLPRSFTFLRARRLKQPCRMSLFRPPVGVGFWGLSLYLLTRLRKIRQPSASYT